MDIVVLAVIGLVALFGLIAFGVGNKGWSWGTVIAAVLLLMASTGYIYLAARLAERERSWRTLVLDNEAKIARIIGKSDQKAGAAPNSLADLRRRRDRWQRALEFVDTWHGRSWQNAQFLPPQAGQPGVVSIPKSNEESDAAAVEPGAEIALFDDASVAEGGRFLGLLRVTAVKIPPGDEKAQLTVVPASHPLPPTEAENAVWAQPHDEVTVYESIPVDRWLAFYKVPDDPAAAGDDSAAAPWLPGLRKTSAEDTLASLETRMREFEAHEVTVPEEEWPKLVAELDAWSKPSAAEDDDTAAEPADDDETTRKSEVAQATRPMPGMYWATVAFATRGTFTKGGGFVPNDGAERPAKDKGDDDEDVGPVGAPIGAPIMEELEKKDREFAQGETAEFDLQTAMKLQDDGFAKIEKVTARRPLTDPYTAIRGGAFSAGDPNKSVQSMGFDGLRRSILAEIEGIDVATDRVRTSQANVDAQSAAVREEKQQLDEDLVSWERDLDVATKTKANFDKRLKAAVEELDAMDDEIVRLGRRLTADWARLARHIDAIAPPPRRLSR